ncbi:hypothetical protein M430DRAFT_211852 [Amorphotheca resinae ATCC 22711]|uniref:Uncharacterized protein n=1 Tax=Amorphotheca resinae ATCC 22711 TaxID=857342 RepID=A0A2T3B828_AMORE|nr:hypothetical protein M430DRAFT_211852 [Amorphotheca resinae ATCC 22711]PSS22992.1 hypothetical protein M430DRAFT_211852 [Amorphotheca resinae ATCC 22711]
MLTLPHLPRPSLPFSPFLSLCPSPWKLTAPDPYNFTHRVHHNRSPHPLLSCPALRPTRQSICPRAHLLSLWKLDAPRALRLSHSIPPGSWWSCGSRFRWGNDGASPCDSEPCGGDCGLWVLGPGS